MKSFKKIGVIIGATIAGIIVIYLGVILTEPEPNDPDFILLKQKCERVLYEVYRHNLFSQSNVTSEYSSEGLSSYHEKRFFLINECKKAISDEKDKEILKVVQDEIEEEVGHDIYP